MRLKNHYYLLRHGKTTWEKRDISYPKDNSLSVALSQGGRKQIKKVVNNLRNKKIDLIFASPFRRTKETAEIIAKGLNLKINFDKRLVDTNLGIFQGRLKKEFHKAFPLKKRMKKGPEGGESWGQVRKRVSLFHKDLENKYQNKKILIVSHGDPLLFLIAKIKRLKRESLLNLLSVRREYMAKGRLRRMN